MSSLIFRCQGLDIQELTISRSGTNFNLLLKTYVLERQRSVHLQNVRELPDLESLFGAERVDITDESGTGREFGAVRIDIMEEKSETFYADECTLE